MTVLCLTSVENPTSSGYRCWASRNRARSLRSTWATTVSGSSAGEEDETIWAGYENEKKGFLRTQRKARGQFPVTFVAKHWRKAIALEPLTAGRDRKRLDQLQFSPAETV